MQAIQQIAVNNMPPQIAWFLRRLLRRLKPQGLAGLAIFVLAIAVLLLGILPKRAEIEWLRSEVAAQSDKSQVKLQEIPPEQLLSKQLAAFQNKFTTVDQLADQMEVLFRLADGHGLTVDKGAYTLVEKTQGPLRRFEMTLPVSGAYPQVRALVMDVLDKLPTVALADIVLEREKISDKQAKATLRFVFFIRKSD